MADENENLEAFTESGPFPTGWVHDPEGVNRVLASLPLPVFAAAAPQLMGAAPADVYLYKAWKDALGKYPSYVAQAIGDCTSFGTGHGIDLVAAVQIAIGKRAESWKEACTEALYGEGREIADMLGGGDGCYGGAVAKAANTVGVVPRELVGAYSGQRAKQWGSHGTPDDIKEKSHEHLVKTVSLVSTWDELVAALSNGYPVTVCSNQGFAMQRNDAGICEARGHWAHCLLPGTLVSTLVPKPIEDLQVGDRVITHEGTERPVTEVFVREYNGDLISIRCVGNTPVRYTDEHPVLVARRDSGAPPAWIPARGVRPGEHLLLTPILQPSPVKELPVWEWCHNARTRPADITEPDRSLAWLFGYFLANGSLRRDHGIELVVPRKKEGIAGRLVDVFANGGVTARVVEDRDTYLRVRVDSVVIERSFRAWFGDGSVAKRIPAFLFRGWDLGAVLRGLYDGDGGTRPDGQVYFDTVSPVLARQVWQAQITQGQVAGLYATRADRPGAYANARSGFRVVHRPKPGKRTLAHFIPGYLALPVKSVTRTAYVGRVYNCEVEGTHSYLADGVASHNCMLIVGIMNTGTQDECAVIANSWGDDAFHGPQPNDLPPFSFGARRQVVERMLAGRDSWALSAFQGFPGQPLPSSWSYGGFI